MGFNYQQAVRVVSGFAAAMCTCSVSASAHTLGWVLAALHGVQRLGNDSFLQDSSPHLALPSPPFWPWDWRLLTVSVPHLVTTTPPMCNLSSALPLLSSPHVPFIGHYLRHIVPYMALCGGYPGRSQGASRCLVFCRWPAVSLRGGQLTSFSSARGTSPSLRRSGDSWLSFSRGHVLFL